MLCDREMELSARKLPVLLIALITENPACQCRSDLILSPLCT